MSSEEKSGGFLTTQNVGKLLMLNSERVRQLVKDGYIDELREGFASDEPPPGPS
jgi:hypothetical protein